MYRSPGLTDEEVAEIERMCPDHFSCGWESCTCEVRGPNYKPPQPPRGSSAAVDLYFAFKAGEVSEEQFVSFLKRCP